MSRLTYTTRPLSDRSWLSSPAKRRPTPFDSTWGATLNLLAREVEQLRGKAVVIEVDVPESGIRLDGGLRANAKAASPAVVVAFESMHGPLLYRCDRFVSKWSHQGDDWQQNVRAIAKTLESLRAVDRYGATNTGQQYTGWKQLDAAPSSPDLTLTQAWEVIADLAGMDGGVVAIDGPSAELHALSRARRNAHPDRGGTSDTWHRFTTAYAALNH